VTLVEESDFDFICLCCGGVNGERHPSCSYFKYVKESEAVDDDEYLHQVGEWLGSLDYKGSLIVPLGYTLSDEYRSHLLEMTSPYLGVRDPGVLLFTLPDLHISGTVNLSRFMN